MKTSYKIIIALVFSFLTASCSTPKPVEPPPAAATPGAPGAEAVPAPNPKLARLDSKIKALQEEYKLPAVQAVIYERDGNTYKYSGGVRSVDFDTPVQPEDRFMIPSAGKIITALLIGQMIDQKLLSWDTPIKNILGKEIGMNAALGNITIEMLLAQTSGLIEVQKLKVWPTLNNPSYSAKRGRELLAKSILSYDPQFTPGSKPSASDSGFIVLGWALEKLTNFSWEELTKNKIFLPLGMQSCGFGPAGKKKLEKGDKPDQPWGHYISGGKIVSVRPDENADFPKAFASAGAIHCTMADWTRFLKEVNLGLYQQSFLLKEETFQKLLGPGKAEPYTNSGLARYERIWSGGTTLMMSGSNMYSFGISATAPGREMSLVVLTNSGTSKAQEGATKILKLLTEAVQ